MFMIYHFRNLLMMVKWFRLHIVYGSIFCESYCDVEDLDYSYYPSARENYNKLVGFKAKSRYFYDRVYDKIIEFVEALRQKHNNIVVSLGDSALGNDSVDFNNYHFSHLKNHLPKEI